MIFYLLSGLLVLFFGLKAVMYIQYKNQLKEAFKEDFINTSYVQIQGTNYRIQSISCSKKTQVRVNSPSFIELITPSQRKNELIPVQLHRPTLIILPALETRLRRVINENEEQFFEFNEKIYHSYIVPMHHLKSLKEHLSD